MPHDLGQQAHVLLKKMRDPRKHPGEEHILNSQADQLIEAFRVRVSDKLNAEGARAGWNS
jgi:hypothetical protein